MNWQLALLTIPTFTGFLIILESIEELLNHFEGGAGHARPQRRSFPTFVQQEPAVIARPDITTRVEWPLPWATLEVEYSDYLTHTDRSPRLVDRSHVAQLPFQTTEAPSGSASAGAFSHLQGIKVRDIEECY